jgi:hypothetical protein
MYLGPRGSCLMKKKPEVKNLVSGSLYLSVLFSPWDGYISYWASEQKNKHLQLKITLNYLNRQYFCPKLVFHLVLYIDIPVLSECCITAGKYIHFTYSTIYIFMQLPWELSYHIFRMFHSTDILKQLHKITYYSL